MRKRSLPPYLWRTFPYRPRQLLLRHINQSASERPAAV